MNKKAQIDATNAVLLIIIFILIISSIFLYINQRNEIKKLNDIINKNNIEYQILRNIIQDYYKPNQNKINMDVNLKMSCQNGTRAFSESGLIEYDIGCFNNELWVRVPILYNDKETKLYVWNGTLLPVILDAFNKTK